MGAGSGQFLADLGLAPDRRQCRVSSDELVLSRYSGGHDDERVRIGRTSKQPVAGRDIVLVADIVSSGLSLVYVTEWLRTNGARSVRICTLLDREDARIIDIPLDFVGFKAPDEVLVGYGLASYPLFRYLPPTKLRPHEVAGIIELQAQIPLQAPRYEPRPAHTAPYSLCARCSHAHKARVRPCQRCILQCR